MSPAGDRLIRLLGGDPEVFRPMYQARLRMLQRQSRIIRNRKKDRVRGASPFRTLCFFAGFYGFFFLLLIGPGVPLVGAGIALTLGCLFLLLIVITEHLEVLVDPREAAVLAAHPHDDRSFLLAKLAVVGRALAILGGLLFLPSAVALGFKLESPAAPFAFLAGAAGAVAATGASGMLLGALILRLAGRNALERLMPWLQGVFQVGYLVIVGSERVMRALTSPDAVERILWAVPAFWFAAPLEIVSYGPGRAALVRLLLAASVLALVLLAATRWLGDRLGERLLEPVEVRPRTRSAPRRPLRPARGDRGRLLALLRVHLRADWRTRSELLVTPLLLVVWLAVSMRKDGGALQPMLVFFYVWLLLLSGDTLTRSSRPDTLWFLLVSPIDRAAFSLGTITLLRVLLLAPAFAAIAWLELRSAGSLAEGLPVLLEMLAAGDLMVLLGKGLFPEFPFSRPARSEGDTGGQRVATVLIGGLVSGAAAGAIAAFGHFGTKGVLTGAAVFALLHVPAAFWARRRATRAVERLELTALAAA
ncbi:MAG: hypothetical protein ACJ759_10320 [Thermoanaerobaculia bacterium]